MAKLLYWPKPMAGDIAWCHFPYLPHLEPEPKPRPVLILKVFDDLDPEFYVLVAYGSSQKTNRLQSGEFSITKANNAEYKLAGLGFDTKFSFNQQLELPYDSDYFKPPQDHKNTNSPKLGMLHPAAMRRAQAAWAATKT
jgi:hypothetical protein